MARRSLVFLLFAVAVFVSTWVATSGSAAAASPASAAGIGNWLGESTFLAALSRGPGGYLSAIKLGCIAFVFFVWVKLADWVNRDTIKISEYTEMPPEAWNPVNLVSCLIGFFLAISIPIFWIGFPLFCVAAFLPWMVYLLMRRSKMGQNADIKQRLKGRENEGPVMEELEQDRGIEVKFTPAGADETEQQSNLIMARQSDGYPDLKELIHEAMFKRADVILIDFTQHQVNSRLLVDGSWHQMEPMDRIAGDAMLVSLKNIAAMNPADRRQKQQGRFSAKTELGKIDVEATTQGVPTGERVQLKFLRKSGDALQLKKLGLFPSMEKKFVPGLSLPGISIVSAAPSQGLTTTWQGVLVSADRLTRDCVGIIDENENETDLENIVIRRYKAGGDAEESAIGVLKRCLLTQPDSIAMPAVDTSEILDLLANQASTQERAVWLRTNAKSAAGALLKFLAQAGDRKQFAEAVKHVTCQKLVRRLCHSCKQEIRVKPELIKKLGGNPAKQQTLFAPWKLPPPELQVDEKGEPIEFPPCKTCGGLGYIGRIAAFELLEVNDEVRKAILTSPKLESIESAAKASKAKTAMSASAFRLVLLGITSLPEVQNVLKN